MFGHRLNPPDIARCPTKQVERLTHERLLRNTVRVSCWLVVVLGMAVLEWPANLTGGSDRPQRRTSGPRMRSTGWRSVPGRATSTACAPWASPRGSISSSIRNGSTTALCDSRLARLTTLSLDPETIAQDFVARAPGTAPAAAEAGATGLSAEHSGATDGCSGRMTATKPWAAAAGDERRHRRAAADLRRAGRSQAPARRLQRAAARRSARRLLVQPLQRVRAQGTDRDLHRRVRARRDPPARARQFPRSARRNREESRRCSSISTTG